MIKLDCVDCFTEISVLILVIIAILLWRIRQ